MTRLLCILHLLYAPTRSHAQTILSDDAQNQSITVIPVAPGLTVYRGSNGSRTEVIQTTPNSAAYHSQNRYGNSSSGTIISPYAGSITINEFFQRERIAF